VQKCPLDLWVYQEIIYEVQPDLIIETGTCYGGSALFFANMLDLLGKGNVITIDINKENDLPKHDRITYLNGSSIDSDILRHIWAAVKNKRVLVNLDSDHTKDYVLKEMTCYAPFVTPGSYMIVEDTNVNGHPVCENHGPGPFEAVEEFLKNNHEFMTDYTREKFMITQNPNGFLRRA
jgi:cephalosporin hydroxylase